MLFLCLGGKTSASDILVLNNESDVPATFQFDVDKTQSVFQVGETTGALKPRGTLYVTVKFVPPFPGIFFQKLACLVLYQEPLLIEAVGVCSDSENISPARLSLTSHWEHCPLEGNYERYMDDCSRVAKNPPELSLSEAYLDFGQAEVGTTDAPLAFSLTSHVDDDMILEWDQDKNKVFHIDPPSTLVPAWRSVLFQVYFRPHTIDLLYSAKLEGRSYRGTHETRQKMEFPLETWISVMGHSFGPDSKMWVPQYKLSHQTVILPACVPSVPVYTTFLIKRFGHLPLMFKFLPPNISNYTVKPSQGVIDTEYQIVVVQLYPECLQETAYVERWGLEFNKSPDQEVSVYFRAYAEHPSLEIGEGNIVLLPPNFPGCEEIVNVPIRNLSRHSVRFGFKPCGTANDVTILDSEGTISANELVHSQWSFRMSSVGFTYVQFICQVWVLQQGLYPAGVPTEYIVTGYGESEHVEIVAEPKHLDFGESHCGDLKVGRFIVINSSRCPIHFLFRCVNFELGNTPSFQDIKLSPTWGSIPKKKSIEATLDVVLGARSVTLKLTCEGVVYSSRRLVSRAPHSERLTDEAPVSISTCHIVLEPFLTHTASQYLFFITNHMASAVYQYTWVRCEVEGVARAWVRPHRGTLPSGESHACCLTIHSLGTSAVLPLNLTCELLELDTLSSCERSDLLVKEMPDTEQPLPWHQVLMVSCDIVSPTDANLNISLLRQSPGTELYLNINYDSQVLPPSLANLMKHILEGMTWVIVSSDWFSRTVIRSNKELTPYYSQFVLNDNEHEKLIQQSYMSPTHGLAGDMLRDIIYHLILQEFHLDTVPHSINTDDFGAATFIKVE